MMGALTAWHRGQVTEPRPGDDDSCDDPACRPGGAAGTKSSGAAPEFAAGGRAAAQLAHVAESGPLASPQLSHRHVVTRGGRGEKSKSGAGGRDFGGTRLTFCSGTGSRAISDSSIDPRGTEGEDSDSR